jgi:virulence-associated protein VapD
MVIIETSIFTQRIEKLMSDDAYKELQKALERFRFNCTQGSRREVRGMYTWVPEHADTEG